MYMYEESCTMELMLAGLLFYGFINLLQKLQ